MAAEPKAGEKQAGSQRADDAHLLRFLELVRPVLGPDAELDESRWRLLQSYAQQAGLNQDELRAMVAKLIQRGLLHDPGQQQLNRLVSPTTTATEDSLPRQNTDQTHQTKIDAFLVYAKAVLGNENSRQPLAARLVHAAHAMGLSEAEFDEAMRKLGLVAEVGGATATTVEATRTTVRPPPWSLVRPADQYRKYLQKALTEKKRERGYLSINAAEKIISEGVKKLSLSKVYARHLLQEVAAQLELAILEGDNEDEEKDPKLSDFLRSASGILAAQRGLTPRAWVLLEDLANHLGLPADVWQPAVRHFGTGQATLTPLEERAEAFVRDLDPLLAPFQGHLLPPAEFEHLASRGEHLYGLPADEARRLVQQRAAHARIAIPNREQALAYFRACIGQTIRQLSAHDIENLVTFAALWNIPGAEIRQLIQQAKQPRQLYYARWAFAAALLAIVLLIVLVLNNSTPLSDDWQVWLGLRGVPPTVSSSPDDVRSTVNPENNELEGVEDSPDAPSSSGARWPAEMELAWEKAHLSAGSSLKEILRRIHFDDLDGRRAASEKLIESLLQATGTEPRDELVKLAGHLLVHEPNEEVRRVVLSALEDALVSLDRNVTGEPPPWVFRRAIPILVTGLAVGDPVVARPQLVSRINELLGLHLRADIDPHEAETLIWSAAVRLWAERLGHFAGDWPAERAMNVWQSLESDISKYLPDHRTSLELALLKRALPKAGPGWRVFQPIIERVTGHMADETLEELVNLVPVLRDEVVQRFILERVLQTRGAIVPRDAPIENLLLEAHRRLGIPEKRIDTFDELRRRWLAEIDVYRHVRTAPLHFPALCAAIQERSRMQLKGWALWKEDRGLWELLRQEEEDAVRAKAPETSVLREAYTLEERPTVREVIKGISRLNRFQRMADRITLLYLISEIAEPAPDIPPRWAETFADYLMNIPSSSERASIQTVLHRFQHWNQLKLSVAARIVQLPHRTDEAAWLLESLYGKRFTASNDHSWPREVWEQLVQEAMRALYGTTDFSTGGDPLAQVQTTLTRHWVWRIKTMIEEAVDESRSTSEILEQAVVQLHAHIARQPDLPEAFRAQLDHLESQRSLVPILAAHDLERAVRWEQIWVELLALECERIRRDGAAGMYLKEAREMTGRHLVEQLYQLQLTGLNLTALLVEKKVGK